LRAVLTKPVVKPIAEFSAPDIGNMEEVYNATEAKDVNLSCYGLIEPILRSYVPLKVEVEVDKSGTFRHWTSFSESSTFCTNI
jgi:hypothetical protein